jgi:predicted nucleic acid-binding protein
MRFFADTSFLCSLYRKQEQSAAADVLVAELNGAPFFISEAVETEFKASLELQVFLRNESRKKKDTEKKGCGDREANSALASFDANVSDGAIEILSCEWSAVFAYTKRFAAQHARTLGIQTMDILHVASACHLRFDKFASFDLRQRRLAQSCGLTVLPKAW